MRVKLEESAHETCAPPTFADLRDVLDRMGINELVYNRADKVFRIDMEV